MFDKASEADKRLWAASWAGDRKAVIAAIHDGADIHSKDNEALRGAMMCNHTHLLDLVSRPHSKSHYGHMAMLEEAVLNQFFDASEKLLETHPDLVQAANRSRNPKYLSISYVNSEAFLLEHGILSRLSYEVGKEFGHAGRDALEDAAPKIEAAIAEKFESERPYARKLAWQSAAIAAGLGADEKGVMEAVTQTLDDSRNIPSPRTSFKGIASRVGNRGYNAVDDCVAIAHEYAMVVLLPTLLMEAGAEKQLDALHEGEINKLIDKLTPLAGEIIFAGKPLEDQLKLVSSWKRAGNSIPDNLRALALARWQPLIDKIETPIQLEGVPVTIEALTSQEQLMDEGRRAGHCLGSASHASSDAMYCTASLNDSRSKHILSIRAGEKVLATVTTHMNNGYLSHGPFEGPGRTPAMPEANQAWNWAMQRLGEVGEGALVEHERLMPVPEAERLKLNEPHEGRWGYIHTPEMDALPPVVRRIGFYPDARHVEKCLDHYQAHLLIKDDGVNGAETHKWRAAMSKKPLPDTIAAADKAQVWPTLVREVKQELPEPPPLAPELSVSGPSPALP